MKKQTHVAFLRGINVGGNRLIKNSDLQECFEKMNFQDVNIVLQSGNVVFTSGETSLPVLTKKIEKRLTERFDYPAKVVVKEVPSVQRIVDDYPFDKTKPDQQNFIVFLSEDLADELVRAGTLDPKLEQVASGNSVVYWTVTKGMTLKSHFGKLLAKAKYKEQNTVRNINTLEKVCKKASGL